VSWINGNQMKRGEICWADLEEPRGATPGLCRPVVVLQSNIFNQSRIQTVVIAAITSNLRLASAPGNVLLPAGTAGLDRDSVVNVSQILTIDRDVLRDLHGRLTPRQQELVDQGLSLVLHLP